MKINANQIPAEGIVIEEEISPKELDLETEVVKFVSPLKVRARASRITNALTVELELTASLSLGCSRCLQEFRQALNRKLKLNYPVENNEPVIDLDPDIREELILDYPIQPLCKVDCKGLCPKCGKNLNEGGCTCGST